MKLKLIEGEEVRVSLTEQLTKAKGVETALDEAKVKHGKEVNELQQKLSEAYARASRMSCSLLRILVDCPELLIPRRRSTNITEQIRTKSLILVRNLAMNKLLGNPTRLMT
jgi:hypothetical protein